MSATQGQNSGPKNGKTGLTFDKARDQKAQQKMEDARIALLLNAPFFGNLILSLETVNADDWLPTLATDGRKLFYNSEFVLSLPDKELQFGLAHEVLHCAYVHIGQIGMARMGNRDKQLWNVALDYCVNSDLVEAKVGTLIKTIKICYDDKYLNWSAEQVYDDLIEDQKQDKKKGKGQPGDGEGEQPFDYHFEEVDDPETLQDEMLGRVLQASAAAGAGKTPAGIQRYLDKILKPVIDWRALIEQNIKSLVKSDYTFMRPSRRSAIYDCILPGANVDDKIDVWVVLDMSGSTSPFAKDMVSEVLNLVDSYPDYRVNIIQFDTEVYNHAVFTPENRNDLDSYEFKGGGGTMFECVYNYWKENQIVPEKAIWFTDGYPCGAWCTPNDEGYADTIWILHGTDTIQPPFGQYAWYDTEAKKQK